MTDTEGPIELELGVVCPQAFQFYRAAILGVEGNRIVQLGEDLGDISQIQPGAAGDKPDQVFFLDRTPQYDPGSERTDGFDSGTHNFLHKFALCPVKRC